jgi:hypothetical protein
LFFFYWVDGLYVNFIRAGFVPIDLDGTIGANNRAVGAAGAIWPCGYSGEISLAVGFLRNGDYVVGAYGNTKCATLATFDIDYNFSGHLRLIHRRGPYFAHTTGYGGRATENAEKIFIISVVSAIIVGTLYRRNRRL